MVFDPDSIPWTAGGLSSTFRVTDGPLGRMPAVVPGLVEPQPQRVLRRALPGRVLALDLGLDLLPARLRVLAGGLEVLQDVRPAHVGVRDPGIDQDDAALQPADGDRLGVLGLGGLH